jgi:hypothetical protein
MDNAFAKGLQQLKKADPERAIEVMFGLFCSIGTMSISEVSAAKYTFDLFRATTQIDETGAKALSAMDAAIIGRAKTLYHNRKMSFEEKYYPLRAAFGEEGMKKIR